MEVGPDIQFENAIIVLCSGGRTLLRFPETVCRGGRIGTPGPHCPEKKLRLRNGGIALRQLAACQAG